MELERNYQEETKQFLDLCKEVENLASERQLKKEGENGRSNT